MDDISAAIRSVLNDPQSMAQIQNIMQSLGANDAGQSGGQNAPGPAPAQNAPNGAGNALQSLLPALGGANQEDDATRLLAALRPLLGEARRKKLDEAVRILKLLHLLPLLRESGILQNIF